MTTEIILYYAWNFGPYLAENTAFFRDTGQLSTVLVVYACLFWHSYETYIVSGQNAGCLDLDLAVNIINTMAYRFNKGLSVREFHSFYGNHAVFTALMLVRHWSLLYQKNLVNNVTFYFRKLNFNIIFPLTLTFSKCVIPVLRSRSSTPSCHRCYVIEWSLNFIIKIFMFILLLSFINAQVVSGNGNSSLYTPWRHIGGEEV